MARMMAGTHLNFCLQKKQKGLDFSHESEWSGSDGGEPWLGTCLAAVGPTWPWAVVPEFSSRSVTMLPGIGL